MIKDFFLLSVNSMKKRKLRSWLTLLGIFIGIAAVVSLISLGDGLRTAIESQFGSLSPDVLTIQNAGTGFGPPGSTAVKKLTSHDIKIIENIRDIKIVSARLIRIAKVEFNKKLEFSYLVSIPNDKNKIEFIYKNNNLKAEQGRLLNENDNGKVVVGSDYLEESIFGKPVKVGSNLIIQGKNFEVIGILKRSNSIIFNKMILMSEEDIKDVLNINDEFDIIIAKVNNINNVERVAKDIENALRKDRKQKKGEEDFTIQTSQQSLQAINTILKIINIVVIGIASISLFIGGIGIANTMYSSVLERTKDIGVMKAIGAKNSDIMLIFVIESGLFGVVGGILGSIFGFFLAYLVSISANNYFGQNILKIQISLTLVIGSILFSFLIGVIAGLIPSYQASKMKPVDALRQ
ncbi:MAG: ABC transporter permease [Candidatus Pacearchaeota archaeon]